MALHENGNRSIIVAVFAVARKIIQQQSSYG